jgi:hypothetical protein
MREKQLYKIYGIPICRIPDLGMGLGGLTLVSQVLTLVSKLSFRRGLYWSKALR